MEPTEHFGIYFGYIQRLFQRRVSPFNTSVLRFGSRACFAVVIRTSLAGFEVVTEIRLGEKQSVTRQRPLSQQEWDDAHDAEGRIPAPDALRERIFHGVRLSDSGARPGRSSPGGAQPTAVICVVNVCHYQTVCGREWSCLCGESRSAATSADNGSCFAESRWYTCLEGCLVNITVADWVMAVCDYYRLLAAYRLI